MITVFDTRKTVFHECLRSKAFDTLQNSTLDFRSFDILVIGTAELQTSVADFIARRSIAFVIEWLFAFEKFHWNE